MTSLYSFVRQLAEAFFLDLPYMVDSRWRHCEYTLSRNHVYTPRKDGTVSMYLRPRYRNAAFALLLVTLMFVSYGPTFAAVCGTGGSWLGRALYGALCLACIGLGFLALTRSPSGIFKRCERRLDEVSAGSVRRIALKTLALLIVGGALALCGKLAYEAFRAATRHDLCHDAVFSWRAVLQAGLMACAVVIAFQLARARLPSSKFARRQSLLIVTVCVIGWFLLATSEAREADGIPYRHVFGFFTALLFIIPLAALPLARRLFRSVQPQTCAAFALALRHTELLVNRDEPRLSMRRLINALVNGPLYHPLHWFFLPSLVAVMASDDWLYPLCLSASFFSGLLLTWGSISVRWQQMVLYIDRWFFSGTPLVVSVLVIAIASARLLGSSYVTTLLGAAAFGVLFMWVLMTYASLWLFEQAINQALGPQLLRIVGNVPCPQDQETPAEPDYIDYLADGIPSPLAAREHRYIALHGSGRVAVVASTDGVRQFHTYGGSELFAKLANNADVVELAKPGNSGLSARLTEDAHDIDRRIKLYFNVLNLAVVVLLGAFAFHARGSDSHESMQPVVTARWESPPNPSSHFDLTQALHRQAERQRPALIVAASGGGTRAAVYTASALGGLAKLGLADDIVLSSGVSGGGVALAYYAMHRAQLLNGAQYDAQSWYEYRERMADPFIQDVLEGSMEWRIIGTTPLSTLLVESFQRRLARDGRLTFGELSDMGLILNTSITGHPPSDSVLVSNAMGADAEHSCLPFALLSGQRLSFTNVADTRGFPRAPRTRLPDVGLSFVVVSDPQVELLRAAALNANFPPVFPNARVDLLDPNAGCGGVRTYDVTDGGATENLGLISALYALQSSLDAMSGSALPELHIVALEASAIGVDYSQDRGIGTATGGSKERLAGGLTEQLIAGIERRASELTGKPTKLHLHYLALPTAFRMRGGVGTHWMLPEYVTITNPHLAAAPGLWAQWPLTDRDDLVNARLSKQELFALLDALHDPDTEFCARPVGTSPPQRVSDWLCGRDPAQPTDPDLHIQAWHALSTVGK